MVMMPGMMMGPQTFVLSGSSATILDYDGDYTDVDIYAAAGSPAGAVNVIVNMASGTDFHATTTGIYACDCNGFASGSTITFEMITSNFSGKGGAAVGGGSNAVGGNGNAGGPAIRLGATTTFNTTGACGIRGGGGSGGAGGGGRGGQLIGGESPYCVYGNSAGGTSGKGADFASGAGAGAAGSSSTNTAGGLGGGGGALGAAGVSGNAAAGFGTGGCTAGVVGRAGGAGGAGGKSIVAAGYGYTNNGATLSGSVG